MGVDAIFWRRIAATAGLNRAADLPFLLWPLLWAAWLATGGHPEPWRLAALLLAVLLARCAAWTGYLPEARLAQAWRERRFLLLFFALGALCFALPLKLAGALVPLSLLLAAGWFASRRRSYLSDPLLVFALMLLPLAAWIAEGGAASKQAGLLVLAAGLWAAAALVAAPVQAGTASLAALLEENARAGAALLRLLALAAVALAGRQEGFGPYFWLGLGIALALALCQTMLAGRLRRIPGWGWEAAWGGAVFAALAAQFAAAGR